MEIKLIIGANYGDEGKGRTSAHFCNKESLIILTNGGAQRGHTADNHVFHHFGSGTKRGSSSYISKDFLIDPFTFIKEYNDLKKYSPKVYRHPDCRVVTPFDVIVNQVLEQNRGINKHGSCGMGIWETVLRHQNMLTMPLTYFNQCSIQDKVCYMLAIKDYALNRLQNVTLDSETQYYLYDNGCKKLIEKFIEYVDIFCQIVPERNESILKDYTQLIFENAQGLLLCEDEHNPHTTPSYTGCRNVVHTIEDHFKDKEIEIIYVTRPYLTRHGEGPFEECSLQELQTVKPDKTNYHNKFQGRFKYGFLDTNKLLERINKDFADAKGDNNYFKCLSITHLDEMDIKDSLFLSQFKTVYRFNQP